MKADSAGEATGVFLELNRRHAPSGEQLHGRPSTSTVRLESLPLPISQAWIRAKSTPPGGH